MQKQATTHWLEDFSVGEVFAGGPRKIGERDLLFCALWGGDGQPHSNEEYSKASPWGRRIIHGDGTLAMGMGLIHGQGIFADSLVGYESMAIKYPRPLYIDDEISARLTIESVTPRSAKDGIVVGKLEILNDTKNTTVVDVDIHYVVKRRS
jgi:acyl dehydratase